MGTPDFAVKPLERLYDDGHDIACVLTQPDRPRDRGLKTVFCPVKCLAMSHNTPIYQPDSLSDPELITILRDMRADIIVVVAYGKKLPSEILHLPPYGCINLHGSLLPRYRGAAPVQWAVLNGDLVTGVTSMYMTEEIDAGDIIYSTETSIGEDETSGELRDRLCGLGAEILSDSINTIMRNEVIRIPQNHSEATYAPALTKECSPICWTDTAYKIKCRVRGLNPWPVATTRIFGTTFKVYSVDICGAGAVTAPGTIVSTGAQGIVVACADGTVTIRDIQAPGGKRMATAEYLKGHPICPGNAGAAG